MISLFPLALGQLLDCQLDIATQLPGKPHYFKLFRLLGVIQHELKLFHFFVSDNGRSSGCRIYQAARQRREIL